MVHSLLLTEYCSSAKCYPYQRENWVMYTQVLSVLSFTTACELTIIFIKV
jgi:hypothetical protein